MGDIPSLLLPFLGVSALLSQWVYSLYSDAVFVFRSLQSFSPSGFAVLTDDAVVLVLNEPVIPTANRIRLVTMQTRDNYLLDQPSHSP